MESFKNAVRNALNEIEIYDRSRPLSDVISLYPKVILPACQVCWAMPSSQVSVERLFSGVRFVQTDLRSQIGPEPLDRTLFMRVNGYLL